jgi:phospholipid-binding lipoprotein MlaA
MEDLRLAQSEKSPDAGGDLEDWEEEEEAVRIADPMEPINRAVFHFNDKLYFWFLKPVATGYKWVVPEILRIAVRNFFTNVAMPVRVVNCILQGKFESSFNEVGRFLINSTAGMGGLVDVAKEIPELPSMQEEDFDQTLGVWGLGQGFFINVPVFGPSSVRGAFGQAADYFLDPASYLDSRERIAVGAGDAVNRTSLTIGDYESLKEAALDPYIALRDAYVQNRKKKIAE